MKTFISSFCLLLLFASCKDTIKKPDNLIEEDQMVNIIYDLTILDGIKSSDPAKFQSFNQNSFVYHKYNIDSLQFVKSNQYYASDIHKYKELYDRVNQMVHADKERTDSLMKNSKKEVIPAAQVDAVVK